MKKILHRTTKWITGTQNALKGLTYDKIIKDQHVNGFGSIKNLEKSTSFHCIFEKYKNSEIFSENFIEIRALFTKTYDFKRSSLKQI